MPPRRLVEPEQTCEIRVDGDSLEAVPGEPLAIAIAAAGRLVLGRSVKYHRPRGAFCHAGRCDGCLMRVDGVSSVMTCTVPAREGMVVETQNVVGSAKVDLLAATDWFFPRGMDHHHMFTWSKPVNQMMQKVARRIAGIGRLPDEAQEPVPYVERDVDVLVVGGGPAGLATAAECAGGGVSVLLVEETGRLGGHLALLPGNGEVELARGHELEAHAAIDRLVAQAREAGAELATARSAVGVYDPQNSLRGSGDDVVEPERHTVLVIGRGGPELVFPRRMIVAAGAHEGPPDVPGNDIPGVIGIRAAAHMLRHGVVPGERVALVGGGHWVSRLAKALEEHQVEVVGPFRARELSAVHGRTQVKSIEVARDGGSEDHPCDAVAWAGPCTGAYELASQAGAAVAFDGSAFHVEADRRSGATAAPWLRCVGQCTGQAPLPERLAQARRAGRAIAEELGRG